MLILASIATIAAYLLLYAGVKGVYWSAPWKLLTAAAPPAQPTRTA